MEYRTVFGVSILAAAISCSAAIAQTATAQQEGYKPYVLATDESGLRARGAPPKNPSAFTSTYVLVCQGASGQAQGLPPQAAGEFRFPSLSFMFSAAAKLMTDDLVEPGKMEGKWLSDAELRKLHVNVKVRGLDANKKPMMAPRRPSFPGDRELELRSKQDTSEYEENPYIAVLALTPSESQFRTSEATVSKEMTSIDIFSRFMGPYGGVVSGVTALFKNWFRTKDSPTQVAYMSADDEFGWSWRDAEQFGIEGIHQCAAALRTRKEVKYLHVHLDFITEWRRFGAWMKAYDYIIAVPQEAAAN